MLREGGEEEEKEEDSQLIYSRNFELVRTSESNHACKKLEEKQARKRLQNTNIELGNGPFALRILLKVPYSGLAMFLPPWKVLGKWRENMNREAKQCAAELMQVNE